MRHHHWLLAAIVLVGLWTWSKRVDNPDADPATPAVQPQGQPRSAAEPLATPAATPESRTGDRARTTAPAPRLPAFLPAQAGPVLDAIARGGPYRYRQDGGVFQNRERRLPAQPPATTANSPSIPPVPTTAARGASSPAATRRWSTGTPMTTTAASAASR